jgi:hypothetical protein
LYALPPDNDKKGPERRKKKTLEGDVVEVKQQNNHPYYCNLSFIIDRLVVVLKNHHQRLFL